MKHIKQLILGTMLGIALPFSIIQAGEHHESLHNIFEEHYSECRTVNASYGTYDNCEHYDTVERSIKRIKQEGGNVKSSLDIQDTENGDTLLHVAVKKNDPRMARILLKNGADHTIENKYNKMPVHCICATGELDPSIFDPFNYLDYEMKKAFRDHRISVIDPSEYENYC